MQTRGQGPKRWTASICHTHNFKNVLDLKPIVCSGHRMPSFIIISFGWGLTLIAVQPRTKGVHSYHLDNDKSHGSKLLWQTRRINLSRPFLARIFCIGPFFTLDIVLVTALLSAVIIGVYDVLHVTIFVKSHICSTVRAIKGACLHTLVPTTLNENNMAAWPE